MSSLRRYLPPANEFCSGLTYDWCLDLGFICVGWIHFLLFNLTILVFGSVAELLSVSIIEFWIHYLLVNPQSWSFSSVVGLLSVGNIVLWIYYLLANPQLRCLVM
jgi:hypothetical protein